MKNIIMIFRKLRKNSTSTTLGIAGLVTGIVCVIYIFLLVMDEISYDRFHTRLDRIFVVHAYLEGGTSKVDFSGCPPAVATALKQDYPEVETSCRYIPGFIPSLLTFGENKFMERISFADFTFFDIFTFPFVYGDRGEANDPNQIVITETAALKYFGKSNPVGKTVKMNNRSDMRVVGILKEIPKNSSITFDAIIPLENIGVYYSRNDYLTSWYNNSFTTFGLLAKPDGYEKVASTITRRIQKVMPESTNFLRAYKYKDRYLYIQNHIRNVRIFVLIGLLVLLAATLNFINLNTARSSRQAKETGLRKTFGATRMNVVGLIYKDVAFICLLAFVIAIGIVYTGLPLINKAVGKEISFAVLLSLMPMAVLTAIYLVTVIMAGSYPAFFLSSFSPGQILSSGFQSVKSRGLLRNSMVIVLFTISVILLASTLNISKQTTFLQKMDLGFEKDQLMYINLNGKLREQTDALKQELGRSPDIISATVVSYLPTRIGNNGEGWNWEGKDPNFKPLVTTWDTDEDLLKTFGAKMVEGDLFNRNLNGIVINKTFADMIGWDSFAGKSITNEGSTYRVTGVIKDIHFNSLSNETKPMVIEMIPNQMMNFMVIKVNRDNIGSTIDLISKNCQSIEPTFPVQYSFLNDDYNQLLVSEINLKKLVGIFSGFAIMVLCLGLLGMVMFLIEQKTKEIGIRKCLGENMLLITAQLIKPFLITGMIAGIIGIPLTWFIMKRWLQNYAYHINLNIWIFILSGVIIIGIAVLTVLWQSWRAASRNPVEALRYE
jgi:putative ABC transport system permease protein